MRTSMLDVVRSSYFCRRNPMPRQPRRSWSDLQLDAISSVNDAAIDLTELGNRMQDKRNTTWVDRPLLFDRIADTHEATERVLSLMPREDDAPLPLPVGVLTTGTSEVEELRDRVARYEEDARRQFAFHNALEQRLERAGVEWYGVADGVFWRVSGQSGTAHDWHAAFLTVIDVLLRARD